MAGLQSMTGFASASRSIETHDVDCDVRSVNNKGLDIRLRLPSGLEPLEAPIKKKITDRFARGSVQLSLSVSATGDQPAATIDEKLFRDLAEDARKLATATGIAPPTADGLLLVRGVVQSEEADSRVDLDLVRDVVLEAVDAALNSLEEARTGEGSALEEILSGHLAFIERLAHEAEEDPANTPEAILARLEEQVAALAGTGVSLDETRLNAEAALLATKADIREEIDRLKAHVAAGRALLEDSGAVGRKLDFLAQEFNRETNTICSKSASVSLTAVGLELKAAIDRFREQVQNLQ